MACEFTSGRLTPCKSVGGLKNVYFAAFNGTASTTDGDGIVTNFLTPITAYKWELRGANTMDEANEVSRDNNTSFYTATGTFQFKKQDAVARQELEAASNGRHYVITEGFDGSVKVYGLVDGCDIAVSSASGAAMGDFSGYNVTVTGLSTEPSKFTSLTATGLTISAATLAI